MVVGGGVEPRPELHLLLADAVGEDVGVDGVGLPGHVAQKLVVDLVVVVTDGRRLWLNWIQQNKCASIIQLMTIEMKML